jgi:hypothetical protein
MLAAGVDLTELFAIYPHGLPFGAAPADGVRGFGWPTLAAWILIWAAGFAVAAPAVLSRGRRPRAVAARAAGPVTHGEA